MPFLLISLIFTLLSCTGEDFYTEIQYEEGRHSPLLSIQAIAHVEDFLEVFVGKTRAINDQEEPHLFDSLEARLFHNTDLISEATCAECTDLLLFLNGHRFESGEKYRIEVKASGFEQTAWAETSVPQSPNIALKNLRFDDINSEIRGSLQIQDHPDTKDYYSINNITIRDNFGETNTGYYPDEAIESLFEYIYPYERILPDKSFSGKVIELNISNYAYRQNSTTMDTIYYILETDNLSEDHYRYLSALYTLDEWEYNPFIEPTSLVGNFNEAIGIFAIVSSASQEAYLIL